MESLTKRRIGAAVINLMVNAVIVNVLEETVLKRSKRPVIRGIVTQSLVDVVMETVQLRLMDGRTVGSRVMGLRVVSQDNQPLKTTQILKRIAYREVFTAGKFFKDRQRYLQDASVLPEDEFAKTRVIRDGR